MKRLFLRGAALAALITLAACGQTPTDFHPLPTALGDVRGVALGFERLAILGEGEGRYAAWVNLENRDIIPLGLFNVNAAGQPLDRNGDVIERFVAFESLFSSVAIVISLEAGGTIGPRPTSSPILQGPFLNGVAELNVPAPLFIGTAQGRYRVFSPTNGPDTNENSGVWGINDDGFATLLLPPLNNIYLYEHFVFLQGRWVTMARFDSPSLPDFLNPWSGALPAPGVPGEDFLQNAPAGLVFPADLSGAPIKITLESVLGDSVEPSQLTVLEGVIPGNLQGGEFVNLTNRTDGFPTGVGVIF